MVYSEEHEDRVIRLLRNDAERRNYIQNYMKEYRAKKQKRPEYDRNNIIQIKILR